MELFASTCRSRVCTVLTQLFSSLSALCWGSCGGHQLILPRGAPKPGSDVFLQSPLGFGEGWQDPWEQKQLEGGAFMAVPALFCPAQGVHSSIAQPGMLGAATTLYLGCLTAFPGMSLPACPQWESPLPCWKKG